MGVVYKAPVTEDQVRENVKTIQNNNALEEIRGSIRTETANRTSADSELRQDLSALRGVVTEEIRNRTDKDNELNERIELEEIARANAALALQANLDTEIENRNVAETKLRDDFNAALDDEKRNRQNADNELNANLTAALESETSLREIADDKLRERINAEATVRIAEDTTLATRIDDEAQTRTAEDGKLSDALEAERKARADADKEVTQNFTLALGSETALRTAAVNALTAALSSETALRTSGDSQLSDALETERKTRKNADDVLKAEFTASLTSETALRIAADNILDTAISAEAYSRAAADSKLNEDIFNESTARTNADNQLLFAIQSAINSEASARELTVSNLQSSLATTFATYAPLNSPTFTGSPKAPNIQSGADNLQVANKKYVDDKFANVSNSLNVFGKSIAGFVPIPPDSNDEQILVANKAANLYGWRSVKSSTVFINDLPAQANSLTYELNKTQTPTWNNYDTTKLKIGGTQSAVDAGTYTANFTPLDLYVWGSDNTQSAKNVTWKIDKRSFEKPRATAVEFTYRPEGWALNVVNFDPLYMSQTGTASATAQGTYTSTYVLKSTKNTQWADGSTTEVQIVWKINKLGIEKPQLVGSSEIDYKDGAKVSPSITKITAGYVQQTGTDTATAVGSYTAIYHLTDANTQWTDGSTADVKISWSIVQKNLPAEFSSGFEQTGKLEYTGSAQTPSIAHFSAMYHTITGNTGTDAGTYTAYLSPISGYTWADGSSKAKAVSWKIDPQPVTPPSQTQSSFDYTGDAYDFTRYTSDYVQAKMNRAGDLSGSSAATYATTFTLKNPSGKTNYVWSDDGSTRTVTLSWSIGKRVLTAEQSTGFAQASALTFNGDTQNLVANNISNFSASYHVLGGVTSGSDAGTYTATVAPVGTYTWNDGTSTPKNVTWKIDPQPIAPPSQTQASFDYTGSAYDFTKFITGYDSTKMNRAGDTSGTADKSYATTFTLKNPSGKTNYVWSDDGSTRTVTLSWSIGKRMLTAEQSSGFAQVSALTFNGGTQELKAANISNFSTSYHVLGGVTSGSDATTYTATIEPVTGYTWNDGTSTPKNVTWKIDPQVIYRPSAPVISFITDGNTHFIDDSDHYDPLYMTRGGTTTAQSKAGEYTTTYTLRNASGKKNYVWDNGTYDAWKIDWAIGLRLLKIPEANIVEPYVFTEPPNNSKTLVVKNLDTDWADYIEVRSDSVLTASDAGTYTAYYHIKDASKATWSDKSTADKAVQWTISRKPLTAKQSEFSIDGEYYVEKGNGGSYFLYHTVSVNGYDENYHEITNPAALSAWSPGRYPVIIIPKSNYAWHDGTYVEKTVKWTIQRSTVKVNEQIEIVDENWYWRPKIPYTGSNISVLAYFSYEVIHGIGKFVARGDTTSATETGNYVAVFTSKPSPNDYYTDFCLDGVEQKVPTIYVEWEITRAPIDDVTFSVAGSYEYDTTEQTVTINGFDASKMTISGNKATTAGTHTALISPDSNHCWSDGTTDTKSVEWVISRKSIDFPVPDSTDFAYDAAAHAPNFGDTYAPSYMTQGGDTATKTAAGTYTITFSLRDTVNTCWANGSTESYQVEWSIGMTKVAIPTPVTVNFTYDEGVLRTPTFNLNGESTNIAAPTGDTNATNAKDTAYTIIYALADSTTTVWSDGSTSPKSFKWYIARKKLTATQSSFALNQTLYYTGASQNVTGYITNYDSNYHSIGGQMIQTNADTYSAKIQPLSNYQWNEGGYAAKTVLWTINPIEIAKPQITDALPIEYDNKAHTPTVENYNSAFMTRTGDYGAKTAAGDYAITFTLKNVNNTQWVGGDTAPVVCSWAIEKKIVTIPRATGTIFTYNKSAKTLNVVNPDSTYCSQVDGVISATDAGDYSVTYQLNNKALTEWADGTTTDKTINWKINKATLTALYYGLFITAETYTGNSQSVTHLAYYDTKGKLCSIQLSTTVMLEASGTLSGTDAGEYTAYVAPTANYTWNDGTSSRREITWRINPMPLTKDVSIDNSKTIIANGSAQSPTLVNYDPQTMDLGGDTSKTAKGEYVITVTPKSNYCWSNGSQATLEFDWAIVKNVFPIPEPSATSFVFSKTTREPFTYDAENIIAENASASDAGTYTATFTLANTTSSEWADGTVTPKTKTWTITPKKVSELVDYFGGVTWTGNEIDMTRTWYSNSIGAIAFYYLGTSRLGGQVKAEEYELSGETSGTDAGLYTLVVKPSKNYCWRDGSTDAHNVTWAITPRSVRTPELDESVALVYNGSAQSPTITNYDSTTMVLGGTTSATNAGTYTITVTPAKNHAWSGGDTSAKSLTWEIQRQPISEELSSVYLAVDYVNCTTSDTSRALTVSNLKCKDSNGDVINFSEYSAYMSFSSEKGTAPGTQLTATLKLKDNYCWADGSTADKVFPWYISKIRVARLLPSNSQYSATYTGKAISFVFINGTSSFPSLIEVVDYSFDEYIPPSSNRVTFKATDAGEYYAVFALRDTAHYCWGGTSSYDNPLGDSERYTIYCYIGTNGKEIVTPPTLIENAPTALTYNGGAWNYLDLYVSGYDSSKMTASGTTSATAKGSYTLTINLKDKTNYIWEGGGTGAKAFKWNIVAQALSATKSDMTPTNYTYNGSVRNLKVKGCGTVTATGTCAGEEHIWSGTISATNAGTYTATVKLADNLCWADGTTSAKNVDWTISPILLEKPTAAETTFTYDGKSHTLSVSNYNSTYMERSGNFSATNVTSTSVTYTLKNTTNTKWKDGTTEPVTINWKIEAASLAKPTITSSNSFEYNGSAQSISVGGYDSATMSETGALSATAAGTYSVTYMLRNPGSSKWADGTTDDVTLSWTITPKPLTLEQSTLAQATPIPSYNGSTITVTITNFDARFHEHTSASTITATNAGEYAAYIMPKANYCWNNGSTSTKRVLWKIAKNIIALPTISQTTFEYDGAGHFPASTYDSTAVKGSFLRVVENDNDWYYSDGSQCIIAARYYSAFRLLDMKNTQWEDGTTANKNLYWEITPKYLAKPSASAIAFTYNGAAQGISVDGYDSATMNFSGTTSESDAGTYEATYALADKTNYRWVSDVADDTADVVIGWEIKKLQRMPPPVAGGNTFYAYGLTGGYTGAVQKPEILLLMNYRNGDWTSASKANAIPIVKNGELQADIAPWFDVTGDFSGTNAGDYTLNFTPNKNCTWGNGGTETRTWTWTIPKGSQTIALSKSYVTLNDDNLSSSITVTAAGSGTISVTAADTDIVTASYTASTKTIKLTAKQNGTTTVTVGQEGNANYNAAPGKFIEVHVNRSIESLSWAEIQTAAKDGSLLKYGGIGDTKSVAINGKVGTLTINDTYKAVLIGFNHNADVEGTNRAHFAIFKDKNGNDFVFTDSQYNQQASSTTAFTHVQNSQNTFSYAAFLQARCDEFLAAFPNALKNVITACFKSYRAAANSASIATANYKVWILATSEIGSRDGFANAKCAQYEYFANGNDIDGGKSFWTRDLSSSANKYYIYNGKRSAGDLDGSYSSGIVPCFTIS